MSSFLVQTILLLLVAFILGSLLGRFLKGRACKSNDNSSVKSEPKSISSASYEESADKLSSRD